MIIAIVIGVSCLFWTIAAILFVCAKGVDRRISKSKKDCVEKTTATVVDVEEVYKRNVDTYNYTWYPAYEFYVNGERVVQKSVIGTGKNSVQTGQQTILYYNPENPHDICSGRKSDVCIGDPENNRDCFCDLRMFSGNHWFRCV